MTAQHFEIAGNSRPISLVEAPTVAALAGSSDLPPAPFVLLLAMDSRQVAGRELAEAAKTLIARGAAYVCCWGPSCERCHDVFDQVYLANDPGPDQPVLMTTWHAEEPLEEATWFALNAAFLPSEASDASEPVVIATIGQPAWTQAVQAYLAAGAPLLDEA